jgi:hypothetical protein
MGAINLMGGATGNGGVLAQLFGSGTKGASGYVPGLLPSLGSYFGGNTTANNAASEAAANQTASNVNMGILAPDAGGTPYVPLPDTDSSLTQGEVG